MLLYKNAMQWVVSYPSVLSHFWPCDFVTWWPYIGISLFLILHFLFLSLFLLRKLRNCNKKGTFLYFISISDDRSFGTIPVHSWLSRDPNPNCSKSISFKTKPPKQKIESLFLSTLCIKLLYFKIKPKHELWENQEPSRTAWSAHPWFA